MKYSQFMAESTDTIKELAVIYLTVILVAAGAFALLEHRALFDSIWWSMVTAMTVGYGDIYPLTVGGKVVGMFLMHIAPLFIIPLVTARLASKFIVNSDAFTHQEQEEIKLTLRRIEKKINKG